MENTSIARNDTHLKKIYFGGEDSKDYIVISADDPTMFDNMVLSYKQINDLFEETRNNIEALQKPDEDAATKEQLEYALAVSRENVLFSKKAVAIINGCFGADTVRKYFSDVYAELPEFTPDYWSIMDFYEKIIPVMEETYSRRLDQRDKERRKKMEKYKPQDRKRRGK